MIQKTLRLFFAGIYFWLLLLPGCDQTTAPAEQPQNAESPLFRLTSPAITGVDFTNNLTEGLNTNILMYEYFYNGGGVAVGDVNGDGNLDLYFTSNMEVNKLYLNTAPGKLTYQEVADEAGVGGRPGPWKTGASMVDINGDSRMDIYLCYSGALPEEKRKNEFYINQGNNENGVPVFKEMAETMGLASGAFSNQAYYFDYDRDGDLDILLLNHNPRNLPILNEVQTKELLQTNDPLRGVRLFRNDQGFFNDVTNQVGISSSELTYGLGIGISDLNNDGWPDFYVSNDYAVPDYLYYNNQDGTFSNTMEKAIGHSSQFSMGNDVADINNDGQKDIITLDMLPEDNRRQKLLLAPDNYNKFDHNVRSGFYYQYMRNMLQLNNGNNTYSEVGQLAGISNTDWSWAALAADYNNDGWKDLYITNGYHRDYTNLDFINYMESFVEKKGRLVREDVLEIIENMPASDIPNYMYQGSPSLKFTNKTFDWGMQQIANSNGAVYADLDNDGDLDLVVNNINQKAFLYENLAADYTDGGYLKVELKGNELNTSGIGSEVTLFVAGVSQVLEQFPTRGYLSSVSPVLHFGVGGAKQVDSLMVRWASGKTEVQYDIPANTKITLVEAEATGAKRPSSERMIATRIFETISPPIKYTHAKWEGRDFDRQSLLISELSVSGPVLRKGDINGDGLPDLFVGGGAGQAATLYLQTGVNTFLKVPVPDFQADKASVDTDAVFFDANGDSHLDLYVSSGGYHLFSINDKALQDRLYLNDGKGMYTKSTGLPKRLISGSTVSTLDINQDGFLDVFIGGRVIPGRYPELPSSYLLVNDGKGNFSDATSKFGKEITSLGMITDSKAADLNQDGVDELIVVGEWTPLKVFGTGSGKLVDVTATYLDRSFKGFWNTLHVTDLNRDGLPDIVAGNMGTNVQFDASQEQPAELYYADFDNNGSVDPIFCYYIQGTSYPYVTRDELLKQMVAFKSRYTSYESFADVTIHDLFTPDELNKAGHLEVNHLKTSLFLSQPNGTLAYSELPVEAQFAPVYAINELDFNGDGNTDLLLCGNNSHLKLRLGKSDANYGMLFQGDGSGGFRYLSQVASGMRITGDVRDVIQFNELFLFGINQKPLQSYQLKP